MGGSSVFESPIHLPAEQFNPVPGGGARGDGLAGDSMVGLVRSFHLDLSFK